MKLANKLKKEVKKFLKQSRSMKKLSTLISNKEEKSVSSVTRNYKSTSQLMGLDYARFSALLPYRYYDHEDDFFINDQSIGFGFELAPLTGANESIIHALSEMIKNKFDETLTAQVMMVGGNKVESILSSALAPALNHQGVFNTLALNQYHYLKHAAIRGFKNKRQFNMQLKDYHCYLFISKRTGYSKREARILSELREELYTELKNVGIPCVRLTVEPFLNLVAELCNPNSNSIEGPKIKCDSHKLLNEQFVSPAFSMQVHSEHLKILSETRKAISFENGSHETDDLRVADHSSEVEVVALSLKQLPEELALWMQADNFSNIFKTNQGISCPFVINVHFKCKPQERSKLLAYKKASGYEKKANSAYAKLIPGTVQAAQDWKKIRDDLASDEVKLCGVYFSCVLFTNKEQQREHVSSAISAYRLNGIDLYPVKYQQLQSYLALFPFAMEQGLWLDLSFLGRLNTMTTWNLTNMLPLVADFKGSSGKGVFAPTFRHQASTFDIFDETLDNYNTCICATSGSGKSVLSQAIITSVLAEGGMVWVIDLGQSYKKLCETLGGTYLDVNSLKLNPFSDVKDMSHAAESIRDLIAVMASPQAGLCDVQKSHLLEAVQTAFKRQGHNTTIDDVIYFLEEQGQDDVNVSTNFSKGFDLRLDDIVTLLKKFSLKSSPQGLSSKIFNGDSTLGKTKANFVVLELGELESQPDLLKAILFSLILSIENEMYQGDQNKKKLCVIDEAWRLLSGSNKIAATFIEKGFRTARKHKGAFLTISQSINDFYASTEAKAAWSCAENKIIMRQNDKSFKDFLSDHTDYFDAYQQALIKNFKPSAVSGFSEFMVQQGAACSFHRLFLDPFSRIMFSSKAEEHNAVKEFMQKGVPVDQAIYMVAQHYFGSELLEIRREINE